MVQRGPSGDGLDALPGPWRPIPLSRNIDIWLRAFIARIPAAPSSTRSQPRSVNFGTRQFSWTGYVGGVTTPA